MPIHIAIQWRIFGMPVSSPISCSNIRLTLSAKHSQSLCSFKLPRNRYSLNSRQKLFIWYCGTAFSRGGVSEASMSTKCESRISNFKYLIALRAHWSPCVRSGSSINTTISIESGKRAACSATKDMSVATCTTGVHPHWFQRGARWIASASRFPCNRSTATTSSDNDDRAQLGPAHPSLWILAWNLW